MKLLFSIALPVALGFLGSVFTKSSINTWYASLKKPVFNPPPWIFAPVWTVLYLLMGTAAYLVWNSPNSNTNAALIIYYTQLFLNASWSPVFFGMRSTFLGLVVLILLWFALAITVSVFFSVSRVAGFLLLPYMAWTSFALVLNITIYRLNR